MTIQTVSIILWVLYAFGMIVGALFIINEESIIANLFFAFSTGISIANLLVILAI